MTSGKQAKLRRRVEAPPVRPRGVRRQASPRVLVGGGIVLAAIVVGIVLAVVLTSSSHKATVAPLPEAGTVAQEFARIPQHGQVLGSPGAPVTIVEYIDLQCPSCQIFETTVMPAIVDRYVRSGKVKVEARPIAIIGPDSIRGQRAALAAGLQNHLFDFAQILYVNQGPENTGWLDETTVRSAAASIPALAQDELVAAQDSSRVRDAAKRVDEQASADRVTGTPTVYVRTAAGKSVEVTPGRIPSLAAMTAAISAALG